MPADATIAAAASAMPARSAARLACSAASPRFQEARSAASSACGGHARPAPPARPSASMLVQLPGIALAIFFSGSATQRAPLAAKTSGASPSSASPITRLVGAQRDLVGEAVDVLPVDRQQQVEAVVQRVHRLRARGAAAPPPRRRGSAARWCAPSGRTGRRARRRRAASCRRSSRRCRRCRRCATDTDAPRRRRRLRLGGVSWSWDVHAVLLARSGARK